MLHTFWIRGLNNPFPECRGRLSSVSPLCRNSRLLARLRHQSCVLSRTGSALSGSPGHTDCLLHTSESGRMATFSRKPRQSQLAPRERAKLFQGPLSRGEKNPPKTLHWHRPNHSRTPHKFLHRTSAGEGRRWETKAEERRKELLELDTGCEQENCTSWWWKEGVRGSRKNHRKSRRLDGSFLSWQFPYLSFSVNGFLALQAIIWGLVNEKKLIWTKAHSKSLLGTSLVAQWLKIRLPMQGTWVWALVRKDPTCRGATRPLHHNYWACAL